MLTLEKLNRISVGVFQKGEAKLELIGKKSLWFAIKYQRGWTIKYGSKCDGQDFILNYGRNIINKKQVRKLVPCDKESLELYI